MTIAPGAFDETHRQKKREEAARSQNVKCMLPHCKVAGYVFCVFFMYIKETKKERERDKKMLEAKAKPRKSN